MIGGRLGNGPPAASDPGGVVDGQGIGWTFATADGRPTGPHGPWARALAEGGDAHEGTREFRPVDGRRWGIAVSREVGGHGGRSERFWSASAAIELLPEAARWRAWALTDPEGWQIRLTTPIPGCEPVLAAMGQGAFLGALEGVDGPHTSAIVEFQRPGEPPRCWVSDAEQVGLTLPYRAREFLMVAYLPGFAGDAEHTIVSSLDELRRVVSEHRARADRRAASR